MMNLTNGKVTTRGDGRDEDEGDSMYIMMSVSILMNIIEKRKRKKKDE